MLPAAIPDLPPPSAQREPVQVSLGAGEPLFLARQRSALTIPLSLPALCSSYPPSARLGHSSMPSSTGNSRNECWEKRAKRRLLGRGRGAPWPVHLRFLSGRAALACRSDLSSCCSVALVPVLFDRVPYRKVRLMLFSLAYPVIAFVLLWGGLGLEPVESSKFGGIMLTLTIGVSGIVLVAADRHLLALGRRSDLLVLRVICVCFIEFIRGVPHDHPALRRLDPAQLFPAARAPTSICLLRVLIMVTSLCLRLHGRGDPRRPSGHSERADRSSPGARTHLLEIDGPGGPAPGPQDLDPGNRQQLHRALQGHHPGRDHRACSTRLGSANAILADSKWQGLSTEIYVFIAVFFFVSCFAMSRYSLYLERKLETGHTRR